MHGIESTPNIIIGTNAAKVVFQDSTYDGFYVSYNNIDKLVYGSDTTALVVGQMQRFYILNGNHSKEYSELIEKGFEVCLAYFNEHVGEINKFSEGYVK